jgi:uncharacterized membrane protein YidH (DUF202 family)
MKNPTILVFLVIAGPVLALYGWWCLFRTESAMKLGWNPFSGHTMNRILTIFHGVFAIIAGPILFILGLGKLFGFGWAQ